MVDEIVVRLSLEETILSMDFEDELHNVVLSFFGIAQGSTQSGVDRFAFFVPISMMSEVDESIMQGLNLR